jgi:hypothetical protein
VRYNPILTWTIRLVIGVLVVASPLTAQWKRYIDIRPVTNNPGFDTGTRRWIVFAARAGVPGHAFVLWAMEDRTRQMTTVDAFGFYPTVHGPNAAASMVVGTVPGALRDEIQKRQDEGCCTWSQPDVVAAFEVDKDVYDRTSAVRAAWNANESRYQLAEKDCVTFVADVGKAMGISMPDRGAFNSHPIGYMKSLLEKLGTPQGANVSEGSDTYRLTTTGPSNGTAGAYSLTSTAVDPAGPGVPPPFGFQPVITSRYGSFKIPSPLDGPGFRARGDITEEYKNERVRDVARFEQGDVYQAIYGSNGRYSKSRYDFDNGLTSFGAPFPDGTNVGPLDWGRGTYQGDIRAGLPTGHGEWRGQDGSGYVGEWVAGRPQGTGTGTLPGGGLYSGQWSGGTPDGNGVMKLANGDSFVGKFANGLIQNGTYIHADGSQVSVGNGSGGTGNGGGQGNGNGGGHDPHDHDLTGTVTDSHGTHDIQGMEFP